MEIMDIIAESDSFKKVALSIDCPVLRENFNLLFATFSAAPVFFQALINQNETAAETALLEHFGVNSTFLELYSNLLGQMQKKFLLSDYEMSELVPLLECLALSYVGTSQIIIFRPMMKHLHSSFVNIDEKLGAAIDGLEDDLENFEILMSLLSSDPAKTKEYRKHFENLVAARKALKSLPEFIRHSPIAQISQFDKATRSTNWALQLWTETIYGLWFGLLGRTIVNSNDGINGRKYLLEFLEFCMAPVHEAIEFETLDNMLRKVQNDVETRGGFSAPEFTLGNSSPFGALWSRSES